MGVCKDIQYNKNMINIIKLKIYFIEINFNSNIRNHIQIDDQLFFISGFAYLIVIWKALMPFNHFENYIIEINALRSIRNCQ